MGIHNDALIYSQNMVSGIIGILLLVFYSKANRGPKAKLHANLQF